MSLKGKNRAIYSYKNKDKSGSKFQYKDFEKTKSIHTNFSNTLFLGTSLRAASMKYCSFISARLIDTDCVGTNLRGCNFTNATFENVIFHAALLDGARFSGARFNNCYFVSTGIKGTKDFPEDLSGITFMDKMPSEADFSTEIISVVELLRSNDMIRRSRTLHLKNGKINTLSLQILKKTYSDKELVKLLKELPSCVNRQFYTLSFVKAQLKKLSQ